ncbi:DUF1311 domain-containing protein [Massilia violaceinigra]|uniref:DUF1311 domain-containing protein n=1 Tax=Massilia violaceinigra TaxID=2045208 RepID=A0ABY4ACJ2_9BURK|nr:lysozyme inhibitor LprI family protein [Massilia violaceinigra]UOD32510.1 DUF1311 domain-containing protein [Massilia violaceinigra]
MSVVRTILLLALAAGAMPALAQHGADSKQYRRCMDKAVSNPAIMECIAVQYDTEDKRLNVAYRALMARLQGERKQQLQDAQRLWLKYVEANCLFYHDPDGGTAAVLLAEECAVRARAARASELENLAPGH